MQRDAPAALSPLEQARTRALPLAPLPKADNGGSRSATSSRQVLCVVPEGRGDGFRASIRGHLLELADPNSGHMLAPTPDDLLIASIASEVAWSARGFLRAQRLPDDVSVSAEWQGLENRPSLEDISVAVTVAASATPMSDALVAVLEEGLAARPRGLRPHVRVSAA